MVCRRITLPRRGKKNIDLIADSLLPNELFESLGTQGVLGSRIFIGELRRN
jgi:hypothetical protein